MMEYDEIRRVIEQHKDYLREKFFVQDIGIFGSFVKGEQDEGSDVDILVTFHKPIGFFKFMQLEFYLSELLNRKVDLVSRGAIKPHIGAHILKEVQYV
jgi:predicted nucleotidyltransferase